MDIINFDKYLSDNNNNHAKHHYLLPDCHYMIVQCFSNFFFGDPKLQKTTICKHDCDSSKFDRAW